MVRHGGSEGFSTLALHSESALMKNLFDKRLRILPPSRGWVPQGFLRSNVPRIGTAIPQGWAIVP